MRPAAAVLVAATLLITTACAGGDRDESRSTESPGPSRSATSPSASTTAPASEARETMSGAEPVDQTRLNAQLIDAAWKNDLSRARRLIGRGADVNAKDDTEQSAYLISTSEGHLDLLELTLRHGADVGSTDSFTGTGLIRAAERGHAAIVGRLVQAGAEVNHVNELGWTALHEAIVLGDGSSRYVDTVRVLVAAGADLRLRSQRDGVTPLRHAESRGFDEIAALLRGALRTDQLPEHEANRRLLAASENGDADVAALALRAGGHLEARDANRRTPLLLAATFDRVSVARLLVNLGADPNALDDRHDTPWLVTGVTGSVPMLKTLLPADPDPTIENRFGGLSVIPASERGHVTYVRRVVKTGIDVNHVNDLGWTAMLEAVVLGDGSRPYQRIVRLLLDAGADPSIGDHDGVTPLEHARRRGQAQVVGILERAVSGGR